jgi:hypothetical protein
VARVGLQPWRAESFKFSTDPQLEAKVRDVAGLYLNPRTRPPFYLPFPALVSSSRPAGGHVFGVEDQDSAGVHQSS